MFTIATSYCKKCKYHVQVSTSYFDPDGNRLYSNACDNGYDLKSATELCVRPKACIRHNDRSENAISSDINDKDMEKWLR